MSDLRLVSAPSVSERKLRGQVPVEFERFYRRELRYWPGGRVRSSSLATCYRQWAEETGSQWIGFRAIRAAMTSIGHGHCQSSVMFYKDVRFASELPAVADNYPTSTMQEIVPGLVDQIDHTVSELLKLRAKVGPAA